MPPGAADAIRLLSLLSGFRLDLTTETLWEGPQQLPVRPKAWALLRSLVEHPHRLIPQADSWPPSGSASMSVTACCAGPSVSCVGCYTTRRRRRAVLRR